MPGTLIGGRIGRHEGFDDVDTFGGGQSGADVVESGMPMSTKHDTGLVGLSAGWLQIGGVIQEIATTTPHSLPFSVCFQ